MEIATQEINNVELITVNSRMDSVEVVALAFAENLPAGDSAAGD